MKDIPFHRISLRELKQSMKSSKSFRNRKGTSIFEVYKTREELENHIIHKVEVLPNLSLYLYDNHPLEQIWADLKEYIKLYSDDVIDRKAALNDLFKILAEAQSDDNLENVEEYELFLVQELLTLWTDSCVDIVDDNLIVKRNFTMSDEQLKMIERLGYKYDGKLTFIRSC